MTPRPLVFLDTETTSVLPGRRVWEVAMIKRDEQGERETHIFVSDVDMASADPHALRLGGFYDRHPQYSEDRLVAGASLLSRWEAARRVHRWTLGATIVGAVPNFDTETLDPMVRGARLSPAWDYHLVDIRTLALGWLLGCGWQVDLDVSTDRLAELCGMTPAKPEDRHTALGDARWVRDWYDHITADDTDPSEALLTELYGSGTTTTTSLSAA